MSQTEYFVQGPFDVSREELVHGKDKLPEFWQREGPNAWAESVGVYVFAVRTGPGKLIPYYVGQTSKSFQDEVFVARNMRKYLRLLIDMKNAGPVFSWSFDPSKGGVLASGS